MSNTVTRSLYYYDLVWKEYDEKNKKFQDVKNKSIKFCNFLKLFEVKKSENIKTEYILKTEKDDTTFIIKDREDDDCIEFRIVLCKTHALPLVESKGALEELEDYIDENRNIAEITHCVFFKSTEIIGAEFNFSGIRVSMLKWYLPKILHQNGDQNSTYSVKIVPKINNDAYESLADDQTFSLLQIGFKPDSDLSAKIFSKKSIFRGLIEGTPDADVIEVIFKRRKTKKNKFAGINEILSQDELRLISEEYRDDVSKLYVSQGSYSDGVDLLADKLVGKVDILRTNKRTINSSDAYSKIRKFYEEEIK